jgi:FixJ family two-component response regulator
MFTTFFVPDLPPDITESAIRSLLQNDVLVSLSFRDRPTGTVAMLEAPTVDAAERAAAELGKIKLGGAGGPLTVIASETPEGRRLGHLFAATEESEQRACGRRRAYSACVLAVDDDPMCLLGLEGLLSFHLPDVCLHLTGSGDTALRLNRTREFDAILSDVRLPGLDGLALVAEIKLIRPHTPVVLMTGSLTLMPLIVDSGAFGFMRKPVNRRYCVTVLKHAIAYYALSKRVGTAKHDNEDCGQEKAGLLSLLAGAELGASQRQWNFRDN